MTWTSGELDTISSAWQHKAGHTYMHGTQVGQTWLQLHGVGELHLSHCIMSVISELDMECIYDDQT